MQQNDKTDATNKVTSMPDDNTKTVTIGPSYSETDGMEEGYYLYREFTLSL